MKKLTVDRFEGAVAVCELEDGSMTDIERSRLPQGTREGSILLLDANGSITLDREAEETRRKKLFEMQNDLFNKNKS